MIDQVYCSCGGKPERVETTDKEEELYGCGRKGCCVRAYECRGCSVRWTVQFEAPEME